MEVDPAALVGTASKGMGVQKVLTHVLLLCGRLVKRCEGEMLSGNDVSFRKLPYLHRSWNYRMK